MTDARVLIVDDSRPLRVLLRATLEQAGGFDVVAEAGDGLEAIARTQEHQPDIVLLDLSMPRMDGLEALPRLLAVAPAVRIVVLSGFTADRTAEAVMALGAMLYLEKGAAPGILVAALRRVLDAPAKPADPASPGDGVLSMDRVAILVFSLPLPEGVHVSA